ncbi:MAG: hypothetical protein JW939_04955 [Candidatus Thermoplasmatota archaeon]|nr:hypothetical protein [Candidatus Thermoplasmatota archaeon]
MKKVCTAFVVALLSIMAFSIPTTFQAVALSDPVFEEDDTATTATTGDELTFSIKINETQTVLYVYVEYWFGSGSHSKVLMTAAGNSVWNHTVVIPSNTLDVLHYNYSALMEPESWETTIVKDITIKDNDKPEYGNEFGPSEAFTGDPYVFSIEVADNIGVAGVNIEYWFGSGIHLGLYAVEGPPDLWKRTILIPWDSMDELHYMYIAYDDAGNSNTTATRDITVHDNDSPEFTELPKMSTTTGDELRLSTIVTDNIEVSSAFVEFRYGEGPIQNLSLDRGEDDEWFAVMTIPDIIDPLHYRFLAVDPSGNWNHTGSDEIEISDNDPPGFGNDTSDDQATTGEEYTFRVDISDNIDLDRAYVRYWGGTEGPLTMSLSGSGPFTSTIIVPMNWTDICYTFHAVDTSENSQETQQRVVEVLDNDAPEILEHIPEDHCETGSSLPISVEASDNIGISTVFIEYWFGDGDHQDMVLEVDGDGYSGLLEVPVDPLGALFYFIKVLDATGNQNSTSTYEILVIDTIPPRLEVIEDITAYVGDEIEITLDADDNIGIVSYIWTGSPVDDSGASLSGTMEEAGVFSIQVEIKDRGGNSNQTSFTLTVLPQDHDEDEDGIPDLVEIENGLDPNDGSDASLDMDGDGLSNREEFEHGTEMDNADTDGDGFADGYEVRNGFDPLDPLSGKDIYSNDGGSGVWTWIVVILVVIIIVLGVAIAVVYVKFWRNGKETIGEEVSEAEPPNINQEEILPSEDDRIP